MRSVLAAVVLVLGIAAPANAAMRYLHKRDAVRAIESSLSARDALVPVDEPQSATTYEVGMCRRLSARGMYCSLTERGHDWRWQTYVVVHALSCRRVRVKVLIHNKGETVWLAPPARACL